MSSHLIVMEPREPDNARQQFSRKTELSDSGKELLQILSSNFSTSSGSLLERLAVENLPTEQPPPLFDDQLGSSSCSSEDESFFPQYETPSDRGAWDPTQTSLFHSTEDVSGIIPHLKTEPISISSAAVATPPYKKTQKTKRMKISGDRFWATQQPMAQQQLPQQPQLQLRHSPQPVTITQNVQYFHPHDISRHPVVHIAPPVQLPQVPIHLASQQPAYLPTPQYSAPPMPGRPPMPVSLQPTLAQQQHAQQIAQAQLQMQQTAQQPQQQQPPVGRTPFKRMESFPADRAGDFKRLIYNMLVDSYNNPGRESFVKCIQIKDGDRVRNGFTFNEELRPDLRLPELYAIHVRKANLVSQDKESIFTQDLYKFYLRAAMELLAKYFEKKPRFTFLYVDESLPLFVPGETLEDADERISQLATRQRHNRKRAAKNEL
eukprot:TRINITY_DN642_c0_g2_i1.p1 TRINITY_DN642_c0_g2~~TRINITY_DN642_c0_g2_i1.p1  ORF type:complete len:433 (-),score=111.06 TRINITY_DN642_c0_g2_i1:36-1334(-)